MARNYDDAGRRVLRPEIIMTISNYDEARAFLDGESRREITPTMYVERGIANVCICIEQGHIQSEFGLWCRHIDAVTFMRDGRVYIGDELVKTSNGESV